MYYTFIKTQQTYRNVTIDDIFNDNINNISENVLKFITVVTDQDKPLLPNTREKFLELGRLLNESNMLNENLNQFYTTFRIPKRTQGFRTIDAPTGRLKELHATIKMYFDNFIKAVPHDSAHAYVKTRGTVSANKVHQANNSNWFLKIDLKDFFPSCNFTFIYNQLVKIFPFSILIREEECDRILRNIITLCLKEGKLPQGTKLSPLLTNLIMVPIDYQIRKGLGNQYRYTRYADDLLISSRVKFDKQPIINMLQAIFRDEQAPFRINHEKTRFHSKAGSNWNLGIMLNKDNNLTIGHRKKERFRAALFNFIQDTITENPVPWSREDLQHLQGLVSYYKMIEPDYVQNTISKYNQKYNVNFKGLMRQALNA